MYCFKGIGYKLYGIIYKVYIYKYIKLGGYLLTPYSNISIIYLNIEILIESDGMELSM